MFYVIAAIFTVINMLLLSINIQIIIDFKRSQIRFINQQNKNTVDILELKAKL